jgi:hypothetical protein
MSVLELLVLAWIGGLVLMGISFAVKQARRRKEMEHAERMKSLEMGLVPQPSGLDWPAASICIAVGAGVPIGSFLVAWFATMTSDVPGEIWLAPVFVSFAAIGSTRKLAFRIIDPKNGLKSVSRAQTTSTVDKPAFDPDAYDVVGSRG